MTERLYYPDCYLRDFEARVVGRSPDSRKLYLDRTAFYPSSGGQPFDTGRLNGIAVTDAIDEDDGRIAHVLAAPVTAEQVHGEVNWPRRYDHMQQHTGQHLLSAVLAELFQMPTLSFHMGADVSTIEIGAQTLDERQLERVEERANQVVFENRPVSITFELNNGELGLRKASGREGELRVVSIENLDRSACGGTHVRTTGEIGPILIRKLEKVRGNVRIEFLCGMRAVRRASADYRALARIARSFSAPLDETPALVAAQIEKLNDLEKTRRKLATELAASQGRELYTQTRPAEDGIRRVKVRAAIGDELRAKAQAYTAGEKALLLAVCDDPPSVLLACSKDSGVNAGERVKAALSAAGGRGGGSVTMGQGSVPSKEALDRAAEELSRL